MIEGSEKPRVPRLVPIVLTVVIGVIATAVAWLGTRERTQAPTLPLAAPVATAASTYPLAETVSLPHEAVELPAGPHQQVFATDCTICHSTRLIMTQPPFPQKQWAEVVHKMVKTYGAPVTPAAEGQIVEYLTAIRGK